LRKSLVLVATSSRGAEAILPRLFSKAAAVEAIETVLNHDVPHIEVVARKTNRRQAQIALTRALAEAPTVTAPDRAASTADKR
jgi:hypothetical protein